MFCIQFLLTSGISNAFAVLSDPDKRTKYDRYGEQLGPTPEVRRRQHYEDEFTGKLFLRKCWLRPNFHDVQQIRIEHLHCRQS